MHSFIQRHKKGLSIIASVFTSVFLVALVVSAATTIGANISTDGTLSVTGATTLTAAAKASSMLPPFIQTANC